MLNENNELAENKDTKHFDVGNTVVLQHDQACLVRTFKKETEVKIIGKSVRGYDIEDKYGNKVIECVWIL